MYKQKKIKTPVQKNNLDKYLKKNTDSFYLNIVQEREKNESDLEFKDRISPAANNQVNDQPNLNSNTEQPDFKVKFELLREKYVKLQNENTQLLKDNQTLKKLLKKSERVNLLKDIELNKKRLSETTEMLFSKIEHSFTQKQLKALILIKRGKTKDSTFVKQLMKFLYPNGVENLTIRVQKKNERKTIVPPKDVDLINNMLTERVRSEGVSESEVHERIGRTNVLIGYAIGNLNRKPSALTSTVTKPSQVPIAVPVTASTTIPGNQNSIPSICYQIPFQFL